jgi:serine/threonine protein kinase
LIGLPSSVVRLEQPVVQLEQQWRIGDRLGGGGFGEVFEATGPDGTVGAAKFVPKSAGAERELLFVNLTGVRNTVPVIDHGETEHSWVLVMPKAERSLRDYLDQVGGRLPVQEAVKVLSDVGATLEDLQGGAPGPEAGQHLVSGRELVSGRLRDLPVCRGEHRHAHHERRVHHGVCRSGTLAR